MTMTGDDEKTKIVHRHRHQIRQSVSLPAATCHNEAEDAGKGGWQLVARTATHPLLRGVL